MALSLFKDTLHELNARYLETLHLSFLHDDTWQ